MRTKNLAAQILTILVVAFSAVTYMSTVNAAVSDGYNLTVNVNSTQPTPTPPPTATPTQSQTAAPAQASLGTYAIVGAAAVVLAIIFASDISWKNRILI